MATFWQASARPAAETQGCDVNGVGWDILVVLAFILVGGFFAAAEMALVSLREGQVRALAKRGKRGQRAARLAHDPNRFLSAVQIGVTVATLLSGAYGAATLAADLRNVLEHHRMSAHLADLVSFVVVTFAIAFFSLVLGELAPKRIALQRQERISLISAPVLDRIAVLARPVVWLISGCVNLVVRLLGGDPNIGRGVMSGEELRDMVAGAQNLSPDERHIVSEVFAAGKRQIREVLVPRTEVDFLPASMPVSQAIAVTAKGPHSRFPVFEDSYDDVVGFVHARDLLVPGRNGARVGEIKRPVKMLPTSKTVMSALSEMRRDRAHLAIVVDEYGGTAGIVTLEDLVEELIGDIQDEYDEEGHPSRQLRTGEFEVDGLMNLDDFAEQTGIELPDGPYETVAGYLLSALGHLAKAGDSAELEGSRLTVTELDGRRIARVTVTALPETGAKAASGTAGSGQSGQPAQPGQPAHPGQPGQPGQPAGTKAPTQVS